MLCKQTGLYLRPLITRIEKALQKQAICSADQNTFFIYWFLTKLQSIIINQIQNTFGGGLVSGGPLIGCIFCLQVDGPVTHWGAHKWGSFISGRLQYT